MGRARFLLYMGFINRAAIILGNPGLQRGREGKGETGSGKKGGGRGGEGKGERGSPGKLLYTDHFSINYFSELLLASFLIKFKMRPMKSDHTLIWKSLRTLELRTN